MYMQFFAPGSRHLVLVVGALLVTWLTWGSSFVAIRYTLDSVPPLLMMGSRFIVAGAVALAIAIALGARPALTRVVLRDAAVIGAGMITVGMGATAWSSARLDTGIAALVAASAPLWIAILAVVVLRERLHALSTAGIVVGMAGMLVLVAPSGGPGIDLVAAAVLFFAHLGWAGASLFASRAASTGTLLADTGLRMLLGGALLVPCSAGIGELRGFDPAAINALAGASWSYLVIACSLCAFVAYEWLLRNTSSTLAATHAFVNPLVAVLLGAVVLGEHVGARTLVVGAGVVAAVVLLIVGDRRLRAAPGHVAPAEPVTEVPAVAAHAPARVRRGAGARPLPIGRARTGMAYRATPTPAFAAAAARRSERPWAATDGMDALAIDVALERGGL